MNARAPSVPKKAKRRSRPIYFVVRKVIDAESGELLGALVPMTGWDRRAMKERRYTTNTELRADLKKPNNPKFNRLMHALGVLVCEQIDGFGSDPHAAIKRLQREADLFCEAMEAEIPGVGTIVLKIPQSIAFDEMEQSEREELWTGICRHLVAKYWPTMTEDQIAAQAEMMEPGT